MTHNVFIKRTGSENLYRPAVMIFFLCFMAMSSYLIARSGVAFIAILILIPFFFFFGVKLIREPGFGLYILVIASFVALGMYRYIPGIPYGMAIDFLLISVLIALFVRDFHKKVDWRPARTDLFYIAVIWLAYDLLMFFNPESQSIMAWFNSTRSNAFYFLLTVPLVLVLLKKPYHLNAFLIIWGVMSILGTIKGALQLWVGVDSFERAWLAAGAHETHLLFGKLRVFSFYSDAGQFGASQGHTGVMASIVALKAKNFKSRLFFVVVALSAFYGMIISGTRGALAVPFAGFFLYLILSKNIKILSLGILMGIALFVFFKYTTIGNGNYQINRMRSAFDSDDASLQTRLHNQRILRVYLSSRPFGGGIGHAGVKAQAYLPHNYLSHIPTDSGYVLVWAEQGAVGLTLHFFILFYLVIKGSYIIMARVKDPLLRAKAAGMLAGYFGMIAANYGNAYLFQLPTSILTYFSLAFIWQIERMDRKIQFSGKRKQVADKA